MMKRILCMLLTMLMLLGTAAFAEESAAPAFDFAAMTDVEFMFSSGVGAWYTLLRVAEDGSISGYFTDTDAGDAGKDFPNGTIYGCLFEGQMEAVEQVNAYTWRMRLTVVPEEGQLPEYIDEDGVRYITTDPYGLTNTEELILYLPGAPVAELPEEFLSWSHLMDFGDTLPETLPFYGIYVPEEASGFVGESYELYSMGNPWEGVSLEEIAEVTGIRVVLPENAEDAYAMLNREMGIGQVDYMAAGETPVAVVVHVQQTEDFSDISGLYYAWDKEEAVSVAGQEGILRTLAYMDNGDALDLYSLLWHDAAAQHMHALTVLTMQGVEIDMLSLAEQILPQE